MRLKFLYDMTLLISLFPWVSFNLIGGGIQPYFIIIMAISLSARLYKTRNVDAEYLLFLIPIIFFLFSIYNIGTNELIRETVSYTAAVMSFVFFKQYILLYGFPKRIILITIYIWFGAAVLQIIIDEKIFEFFVHARNTKFRGGTGFASEPSYFGLHMASLISLLLMYSTKKFAIRYLILTIISVILSASITGIYYSILIIGSVLVLKKYISFRIVVISALVSVVLFNLLLSNMRISSIVYEIINHGFLHLYETDVSTRSRIAQLSTPFILSFNNYLLPAMDNIINSINQLSLLGITNPLLSHDNKIGSYIGRIVFHWGILFLIPYLLYVMYFFVTSFRLFLVIIIFTTGLVASISPAYPIIPFIISSLYYFYGFGISNRKYFANYQH
jgi:hypothetical protein